MSAVYVSLPLETRHGRAVLRGAELARERARSNVELVLYADAADAARAAAQDDRALAYLGDFHSRDVRWTAPALGEAGILQVAPVVTQVGLGGPTLVRLTPHDGVGAQAIADWLADVGVSELLLVHDHDDDYGVPVGAMCADAARERGIATRARPVWDWDERMADDLGGARALLYVGVAGSGAAGMWHGLHALDPELWLLGSEGVADAELARALDAGPAARTRFFVAQRASLDFYGYEAMALILDAIAAGGGDRAAIVAAARATRDRDSVIGRYSIDADGHTTSAAYGRLAVVGGELAWDNA